jgi:hypothetical protein
MKISRAEPSNPHHFRDEEMGLVDSLIVKRERQKPDFNRRMFDEDFARLLHSTNRRCNLFEVTSNDDKLMEKLLGNVKPGYAPHSIDETVRKLVEKIAQSLIWFGRAYYFLHDDTEQGKIHTTSFSSAGVARLFGTHIQWVPKRKVNHWDRDNEELPREIRILDSTKVMRFDMPTATKRMLSVQNKTLAVLDKHQFGETNFTSQATHENPSPTNHFDFRVWRDTQDRALYRATRNTGWNCRKYDTSIRSDFFVCHRLIRFRRNQVLLRDDILKQLNRELTRTGKAYKTKFSAEISVTDELPSIARLNELEVKLAREEVGFSEIMDYCYKI